MMPPDVKAKIKRHEIKYWVAYPTNFYKKYLQNLKCSIKRGCIHLIVVGIPIILILSIKNSEGGFFCLEQSKCVKHDGSYLLVHSPLKLEIKC